MKDTALQCRCFQSRGTRWTQTTPLSCGVTVSGSHPQTLLEPSWVSR